MVLHLDAPSASRHLKGWTWVGTAMGRAEFCATYYSVTPNSNTFIHCPQTNLQRLLNNAWNSGAPSMRNAVMWLRLKDIFLLLEVNTSQTGVLVAPERIRLQRFCKQACSANSFTLLTLQLQILFTALVKLNSLRSTFWVKSMYRVELKNSSSFREQKSR